MRKQKVAGELASEFKISKKNARNIMDLFHVLVREGLVKDRVVHVSKLGTFRNSLKPRRIYRDIRTGEEIFHPAEYSIQFKPAPSLRNSLK